MFSLIEHEFELMKSAHIAGGDRIAKERMSGRAAQTAALLLAVVLLNANVLPRIDTPTMARTLRNNARAVIVAVKDFGTELTLTPEQRECRRLLQTTVPNAESLMVGLDGANVRNKPDATPKIGGSTIELPLKPGTIITDYTIVWGRRTDGMPGREPWICSKFPSGNYGYSARINLATPHSPSK